MPAVSRGGCPGAGRGRRHHLWRDGGFETGTAELEDLLELPGVDRALAERALNSRRREGLFRDLADFVARSGIDSEGAVPLTDMLGAMHKEGTYIRQ